MSTWRNRCLSAHPLICGECHGFDESVNPIEVHHVDQDRSNNELSNLRPLCRRCHRHLHVTLRSERQRVSAAKFTAFVLSKAPPPTEQELARRARFAELIAESRALGRRADEITALIRVNRATR